MPTPELANFDKSGIGHTTPVGQYPDGASWVGALDMAGNVWEWCVDPWHENYKDAPENGKPWIENPQPTSYEEDTKKLRVNHGGGWVNGADRLRAAYRDRWLTGDRFSNRGFRVVLALSSGVPPPGGTSRIE